MLLWITLANQGWKGRPQTDVRNELLRAAFLDEQQRIKTSIETRRKIVVVIQGDYDKILRYCDDITNGDFFEFVFSYVDRNERFRELDRFLWESRHVLRFQNEYEGNVIVELSEWNDKSDCELNEYFDAFMYYLKSRTQKLNITFFVNGTCSKPLFGRLSRFFEMHLAEPGKGEVQLQEKKVSIGFNSREA